MADLVLFRRCEFSQCLSQFRNEKYGIVPESARADGTLSDQTTQHAFNGFNRLAARERNRHDGHKSSASLFKGNAVKLAKQLFAIVFVGDAFAGVPRRVHSRTAA